MKQEIFLKILKEFNIAETNSDVLLLVQDSNIKLSKNGKNYFLFLAKNSKNQIQKYYYFNSINSAVFSGDFVFCRICSFGENFKIESIWKIISGKNYLKDIQNCLQCMWNNQSVCKHCINGFYFQRDEEVADLNSNLDNDNSLKTPKPDFHNEEEIININDVFDKDIQSENFWKEYDKEKQIH